MIRIISGTRASFGRAHGARRRKPRRRGRKLLVFLGMALHRPNVRRRSTGSMPYPARIGHFTAIAEGADFDDADIRQMN
jgi:hypothetical protein